MVILIRLRNLKNKLNYNICKEPNNKGEFKMISRKFVMTNEQGLHARPASNFTKIASQFKCDIVLWNGEKRSNPKSLISVLAAAIKCGDEIEITCEGEDQEQAMEALMAGLESGLGE